MLRVSTTRSVWTRLAIGLVATGMARSVGAQVDPSFGPAAVKALRDNNLLPVQAPNQFQTPSGPGLPNKDQVSTEELGKDTGIRILHSQNSHYSGTMVYAEGDVILVAPGYRITCDRAYGDLVTRIFTLQGNVHVDAETFTIRHAGSVTINLVAGTYNLFDGEAQISPQAVQGSLTDNLYEKAHQSYGDATRSFALDTSSTTCNKPDPHYEIDAVSTDLKPGRRIIFRKMKLKVLGYTVLRLPFLVVPLDDRTYRNTPQVGEDPDEGYYIKWQYGIPMKNPNYFLSTREEYMTKLGLGLGADFAYRAPKDAGLVSVYHIFGSSDELDFTLSHRQAFSWGTLSIDTDYEKDNHLSNPDATVFNTKLSLLFPQGSTATDRIDWTKSSNDSNGYSSDSETVTINDQRSYGSRTQSTATVSYFDTSSQYSGSSLFGQSSNQNSERIDLNLEGQEDFKQAQAMIQYQQSIPIGQTVASIGSSEETPVLSLNSDSTRIFGPKVGQKYPFTTQLSWGEFSDPEDSSSIERTYFDLNFNKVDTSTRRLRDDVNAEFKQGLYSDNTAEYVLSLGDNLRYDLGPDTGINLRYNYLRPYGYSPLQIDETGQTNYISTDLNFRPIKPLLIGADTGYDLVRLQEHMEAWQQVGLRTEFTPNKLFLLRGLFTYDTYDTVWQSAQFDLTYVPSWLKLSIGADYDGPSHTWSSVSLFLQNFKFGKTTFSTAMTYNGYLNRFDSQQFNFVYDLHCVDAILQIEQNNYGFQAGRQISFYIQIKALPYDTPFGTGTRGQPIGIQTAGSSF